MPNLNQLDFNLLKAFHALYEEKSVSRAAKRLHLSQPAMSGTLHRLRESFDDPLFVRVQRGIEPTSRATALAPDVRAILASIDNLLTPPVFEPTTSELVVKIACTDYAMRAVIVPFLAQLQPLAPKMKVAILNIDENQLAKQLELRQIDFALTTSAFDAPDIHALHLYDESYVCAVGKSHPLAKNNTLNLQDFCQYPHALVSYQGGNFSGVTDEMLANIGKARTVALSVQNFLILPEILQQNQYIAVMPKRLLNDFHTLKIFEPPIAIQGFDKTLVWHSRIHNDPAYQWVRQLIKQVCQNDMANK